MQTSNRRSFLKGSLTIAGWTLLSTGTVGAILTTGCTTDRKRARFLDAVVHGRLNEVQAELDQHPELLTAKDDAGRSAFALAALNLHEPVRDLIRERGYQPDLHECALVGDWERFLELSEGRPAAVNADHPLGGTAMHAIAIAGIGMPGWRVYAQGGDPNARPAGRDFTPLRTALDHPDRQAAELTAAFLLSNDADPNAPQAEGSTALHRAAARGFEEIVEILIRKGATLDSKDAGGYTPKDLAEKAGHRDVVTRLERHAEVPRDHSTSRARYDFDGKPYRAPDLSGIAYGERGKMVGAAHFRIDEVRQIAEGNPLLVHSVAMTNEGAVEACAHTGQVPIVDYLLEHGAPYSLPTATVRNDLKRVRELLDEDPLRIHERGAHDFPLLAYPVLGRGLMEMMELLLERGAEIEWQHFLGATALHYATIGGQDDMVALLLDKGADVDRVSRRFDPAGQTPLQIAESRDRTTTIALLKSRGARS